MSTRECPSCALEFEDEGQDVCPYCGYEFPEQKQSTRLFAVLFAVLLLGWALWGLISYLA